MKLNFEDYVRGVYYLQQTKGEAKPHELAQRLNVSKNTVTLMVQALARKGLLKYQRYGRIDMTAKGRVLAKRLTYKHRLIEVFLSQVLHLPQELIHAEACRLEHGFSDESIKKLEQLLNKPANCPHGQPLNA